MFTTGLQGIHDKISLEISREQLVEGYFNRRWLFILSRWLFGILSYDELKMEYEPIKCIRSGHMSGRSWLTTTC